MSENRHRTVVEITAESSNAEAALKRLQSQFDALARSAGNLSIGGGGGFSGGGGGGSLTPGAGGFGSGAPASALGGTSGTAQTGGGSGVLDKHGNPYTAGAPGTPPQTGGGMGSMVQAPATAAPPSAGGGTGTPGANPYAPAGGGGGGGRGATVRGGSGGGLGVDLMDAFIAQQMFKSGRMSPRSLLMESGMIYGKKGTPYARARRGQVTPRGRAVGGGMLLAQGALMGGQAYANYQMAMSQPSITRSIDAYSGAYKDIGGITGFIGGAIAGGAAASGGGPWAMAGGALVGGIAGAFAGHQIGDIVGTLTEDKYKAGTQQRMEYANQVGDYHAAMGGAQFLMDENWSSRKQRGIRDAFAARGYKPGQAAAMMGQYAHARGTTGAGFGSRDADRLARMSRAGIGIGALAAYDASYRAGVSPGGWDSTAEATVNTARNFGLSGAKAEQLLQQIASHTEHMATKGLNVDIDDTARLYRGVSTQMKEFGAQAAGRMTRGVSSSIGRNMDMLYGGFGELADTQLLIQAGEATGWDYMKMGPELSRMNADKMGTMEKFRDSFSDPDMFGLAYYGLTGGGFMTKQGRTEHEAVYGMDFSRVPGATALSMERTRAQTKGLDQKKAEAKGEAKLYDEMTLAAMKELTEILWLIKQDVNQLGIEGQNKVADRETD